MLLVTTVSAGCVIRIRIEFTKQYFLDWTMVEGTPWTIGKILQRKIIVSESARIHVLQPRYWYWEVCTCISVNI